jgi:RHS repeat-associated protein
VTGAVNREYVWIDDMPVALINGSGGSETTDFIHAGQIDEPLAVTNAAQSLVWNACADPFGTATTFTTPGTTLDMRLPGQSSQLETNSLHQNRWRDYDPSLGRYIEPDPLGIDAGRNVYGYVDGDPLNLEDPTGLWQVCVPIPDGIDPAPGGDGIRIHLSGDMENRPPVASGRGRDGAGIGARFPTDGGYRISTETPRAIREWRQGRHPFTRSGLDKG